MLLTFPPPGHSAENEVSAEAGRGTTFGFHVGNVGCLQGDCGIRRGVAALATIWSCCNDSRLRCITEPSCEGTSTILSIRLRLGMGCDIFFLTRSTSAWSGDCPSIKGAALSDVPEVRLAWRFPIVLQRCSTQDSLRTVNYQLVSLQSQSDKGLFSQPGRGRG